MEKCNKGHHEHALAGLHEQEAQDGSSSSTKRTATAWLKSIFSCTQSPPIRQVFHRRSHYERHGHQYKLLRRPNVEAHLSAIRHCNNSQISIARFSIKDSVKATPSEVVDTRDLLSESSTTLRLYQPMPYDNSIRLLRIYKGAVSDPVEVSLEYTRLDDTNPIYEALSYVWGSSVRTSHIIYQPTRTAIPVTRNLYDALKGVRRAEQDRVIWVDALCINQNDGKEKGTQVLKMNSIYARAARIVVWLGADEAGDADGAFGMLCALAKTKGVSAHYTKRSRQHVPSIPANLAPTAENFESFRKVMMFFCQAWYMRLWVLQEIVLAQDAVFVWGDCLISWSYIGPAIETIRANQPLQWLFETRNLHNAFFMWHLSTVHHNQQLFKCSDTERQSTQDGAFPFLHLLDLARSFEVTDPRDKVYGLLGFPIKDEGGGASSIRPDYSFSTSQVYTQVTRDLLEKEQSLNVLALVLNTPPDAMQDTDHIDNLPSWVPNFNSKATAFPFSNVNTGHQYSAGLSRSICLLPCTNPQTLRLRGMVLDIVQTTGPTIPYVHSHKMDPCFQVLVKWYLNAGISAATLAATLTAGRNKDGKLLSEREKDDCVVALVTSLIDSEFDLYDRPTTNRDGICVRDGIEWKDTFWRFIVYRQPFVTKTGKFGLGPQGMEGGDSVVVLWGGQCPFVINENEDGSWILKGECFVEGWMDGDAVAGFALEQSKEDVVFDFV